MIIRPMTGNPDTALFTIPDVVASAGVGVRA